MSVFNLEIDVANELEGPYRRVSAVVDTGAMFSQLPASLLGEIGVESFDTARFQVADGRIVDSPISQVFARLDGRTRRTICVFGKEEVPPILGAYTLEGFMLGVDPVNGRLLPIVGLRL